MCMTYQASSGIFLMLVLLIGLKKWNECENIKEVVSKIGKVVVCDEEA